MSPIDNSFAADERPWKEHHMIELTRLNGSPLAINCDLIKYAEASPDTVLTLITGEKLVVLEPCSEVSQRTLNYRAAVLRKASPALEKTIGKVAGPNGAAALLGMSRSTLKFRMQKLGISMSRAVTYR
jgi:flagellar protein FlbD